MDYKEKLRSLGWVAKPTTKKITTAHHEGNGRQVGYHTEYGKPGTGVSHRVDATVTGGEARVNVPLLKEQIAKEKERYG